MPFVCANRTLSSRCVLPISQQAAPVTFSNDVCTVIQRPKGTRGVLCDLHSKIDRCSLRLAEKCNGSAISWCFTRKHSMSALQPWQCIVAGVSEDLASRIDQYMTTNSCNYAKPLTNGHKGNATDFPRISDTDNWAPNTGSAFSMLFHC